MLTKLNHCDVIRQNHHNNGYVTVMVDRGLDEDMRYVVATWWQSLGTTWSWGHYCALFAEAEIQFALTARDNRRRGQL